MVEAPKKIFYIASDDGQRLEFPQGVSDNLNDIVGEVKINQTIYFVESGNAGRI